MDIGKHPDRKYEEVLAHMPFWLRVWPFLIFSLAMFVSFLAYLFTFNLANLGALALCVAVLILMRYRYTAGFAAGMVVLLFYGFRLAEYGGIFLGSVHTTRYFYYKIGAQFQLEIDPFLMILVVMLAAMNLREFKRLLIKILP